jgi:hypothetical protein
MKNLQRSALLTLLLAPTLYADRVRVVPRASGPSAPTAAESRPAVQESVPSSPAPRASAGSSERVRVVPRTSGVSPRQSSHQSNSGWHSNRGWHSSPRHHYRHYPRYYGNHFDRYHHRWWYDPTVSHWTFWANGYWWWPGPGGVTYVYVNDGYYPYETSNVYVPIPDTPEAPPPSAVPATQATGTESTLKSPNGERMVQITGENSEAYLYDTTGQQPVFLKVLGAGATRARFSGGTKELPLQILIDYLDGRFALFSASGEPIDPKS